MKAVLSGAVLLVAAGAAAWGQSRPPNGRPVEIVIGPAAPPIERLAGDELVSGLRRLGTPAKLSTALPAGASRAVMVGSPTTNPAIRGIRGLAWPRLSSQGHLLRSVPLAGGRQGLVVGGGSPVATLWAAYELIHRQGVRALLDGDLLPAVAPAPSLAGIDSTFEPAVPLRTWQGFDADADGLESWPLADQQRLLGQLAKLKINRLSVPIQPWQPVFSFEHRGIKRGSGFLAKGRRFFLQGDVPGRAAFGGAAEFGNPPFVGKSTFAERLDAGRKLLRGMIAQAHRLGMSVELTIDPFTFPSEFAPLLGQTAAPEVLAVRANLATIPVGSTVYPLALAQLRALVEQYPEVDLVTLARSSDPAAGSAPAPTTSGSEVMGWPTEARVMSRLAAEKAFVGGGRGRRVQVRAVGSTAAASIAAGDEAAHSARLQFDTRRPVPGLELAHWRKACAAFGARGPREIVLSSGAPRDSSYPAYLVTRAAWTPALTAERAFADLIAPICGEGVWERLHKGIQLIDAASHPGDNVEPLPMPAGVEFVRSQFDSGRPAPEWWAESRDRLSKAMDELYRANQRSHPAARPMLMYHAKRLEFAINYLTALEELRTAGVERRAGRVAGQREHLEKAIEASYNGLNNLGEVARDPSDRGRIAVLNEWVHRPLVRELARLELGGR